MNKYILILALVFGISAGETPDIVIWHKASTNNYSIRQLGISESALILERQLLVGSHREASGTGYYTGGFRLGAGPTRANGRSSFVWSKNLCLLSGSTDSAHFFVERDLSPFRAIPNYEGPIIIRCGIVDFSRNSFTDTNTFLHVWSDSSNHIRYEMGYDSSTSALYAETTFVFQSPSVPSITTCQAGSIFERFIRLNVTKQVNWILSNTGQNQNGLSGQYAIVFLAKGRINEDDYGTVMSFSSGDAIDTSHCVAWTRDGNTAHFILNGANVTSISAEQKIGTFIDQNRLLSVHPNPFNPSTLFTFYNPDKNASISVYNVRGVCVHKSGKINNSKYLLDAKSLPGGVYLAVLEANGRVYNRKINVVK